MKKLAAQIFSFILVFSMMSCNEDQKETISKTINFEVELRNQGMPVEITDTLMLNNGDSFYPTLIKLYLSSIQLQNGQGEWIMLEDVIITSPGSEPQSTYTFNLPDGNYSKLRMGVGLDSTLNASDPLSFPNDNPLAAYQGMYWDMIKYRFAIIEGIVSPEDSNRILVAYHPGTDPLYKEVEFDIDLSNSGITYDVTAQLNLEEIFDGPGGTVDFITQATTHSVVSDPHDYAIAEMIMINLANAIELSTSVSTP